MSVLPTGTVTFLFTDIEGSSRLWENHGDAMAVALARHDIMLREAFESRGGTIFKTIGDAFCVAFPVAASALEGAVAAQRALRDEEWQDIEGIKVRMGIHTGSAESRDSDYFGPVLNRVSRLLAAAHGGQMLLTLATEELVRDHLPEAISLRDLGERRLRDLNRPERVFQVVAPDLPTDFPALRSLEIFPNNLPVQLTTFIGREKEMNEVKRLLETTHLLTLTGTGGTGKTRLSMQVAADLLDRFPDGVWLVELATIEEPGDAAPAIAAPLQVREEPGQPMLLTLTNYLRNKRAMIILDNCEHLIAECARIADTLLRACPGLQILASSREPLGIGGERTWPVPSLSIPESWKEEIRGSDAAERLTQYEAVRLFIDRAIAVRPGFKVTNENAPYVAEICWRLDGIPLAIELAAARIRVLSLDQIASRLDDQFRLLAGGSRTALPRQQTLRALIDWSYDLLSDQERALLRRLSVFAGGRTLPAVEAVCSDDKVPDWEIIDIVTALVDKSLVSVEKGPGKDPRYTMLESVWNYAREKLAEAGEMDELRNRHLQYYLTIAREAEPKLIGPQQMEWLERLRPDLYNFRYSLDSSLEVGGLAPTGLKLAFTLGRFWEARSMLVEGGELLNNLLAHADNAQRNLERAHGLAVAGRLAWMSDRNEDGRRLTGEALEIYRELNDEPGIAAMGIDFAFYLFVEQDFDAGGALLSRTEEIAGRLNDKRLLGLARRARGIEATLREQYPESLALQEASLACFRELGDAWFCGIVQWGIGVIATWLGDFEKARASFRECLKGSWSFGNRWALAYPLEAFAALAVAEGHFPRAARLLGAAEALRAEFGVSAETSDHPTLRRIFARAAEEFVKPDMAAARKEGRNLSAAEAMNFALEE
ncbi:MAG TPA: adenylate/guanylate cyclase domain-containing protein [Chthoniobacteraceae bacterium]|jgi:predicted ATPase/class 3 adenylate cyclase|nr:adenylate/guanylate cyclase domain-containing protein [Chthoniobacteraceae bacterium]